jgi:hypothetical protein
MSDSDMDFLESSYIMVKKGKKWSQKFKDSINCKNPKGFSQKQYCKYGKRKATLLRTNKLKNTKKTQ